MRPSLLILGTIGVGLWFGVMPFVIAANGKDEGLTLLFGFLLMWGAPVVMLAFIWALVRIDNWWLDRKRRPRKRSAHRRKGGP